MTTATQRNQKTTISHPKRNKAEAKLKQATTIASSTDFDYSQLLQDVSTSFGSVMLAIQPDKILFKTDAEDLFETYLDSLPNDRQHHNCHACKDFLRKYGALAAVDRITGDLIPVMWQSANEAGFYSTVFEVLAKKIKRARIVSPFLTTDRIWGTPVTGSWSHIAVVPSESQLYRERARTATQSMANYKENFRNVSVALAEFKPELLDEALRILRSDTLSRSEKFIAPLRWLRELHNRPKGRRGENLLWLAVATAPEGFCHPRASVLAPLLDDIKAGESFTTIKRRFDTMVLGINYQRPKADPTSGAIKAAEDLVAKLGIAASLERRFARLDEIQTIIWKPTTTERSEGLSVGGVFSHLKTKDKPDLTVALPTITMTWEKFARTILTSAEKIQLRVPSGRAPFVAFVTATNYDAPPLLKWDNEAQRNPVSWYLYHNGSYSTQWSLVPGNYVEVTAIAENPDLNFARNAVLILAGCKDGRSDQGNALFPETLKSELHGARSVIEAYAKSATLSGIENASACGFCIGEKTDANLCVLSSSAWTNYHIDRWD